MASTPRPLCVATLNHDLLIEQTLNSVGLAYADGFSAREDGARVWNPEDLSDTGFEVSLLKLHGSVDWFRVRDGGNWESERIAIGGRDLFDWSDHRPQLLLGTFNKLLSYPAAQFAWLHNQFRVELSRSSLLVVSGYSFGDKGINSYLLEWAYGGQGRRLVVIHPDGKSVLSNARGAIRNKVADWQASGFLASLPARIEDATWQEVAALAA